MVSKQLWMSRRIRPKWAPLSIALAWAAATVLTGNSPADAATIYTDSFDRGSVGSPAALNASSPDVASPPANWTATSSITTNGNAATLTGVNEENAFLPLTVAPDQYYQLTATLTPTDTSTDNWLALGFTDGMDTSDAFFAGAGGYPAVWVGYRGDGRVFSFNGGYQGDPQQGSLTNSFNGAASQTPGSSDTFTLTLDTTLGLQNATFSIIDSQGLIDQTGSIDLTVSPVDGIGFGSHRISGTVQNFSETPEPASLALLALGGLSLLTRRNALRR